MARLGRSQPGYRSGHSKLSPPAVVAPPVEPPQRPLAINLRARWSAHELNRRKPLPGLGQPAVIAPSPVIGGVMTQFAPPPKREPVQFKLSPPATLVSPPVETVPRITLADTVRNQAATRQRPLPGLGKPSTVTPELGIIGGVLTQYAEAANARSDGRRAPSSKLSPPAVVTPFTPAPVVPFGIDVTLVARDIRTSWVRRGTQYRVAPPTVVDAEPQSPFPGLRIKLVPPSQGERRRQQLFSKLSPPTVVAPAPEPPVETTVRIRLTEPHRPAPIKSRLSPPAPGAVAAAPPVDTTLDITLAASRDPRRRFAKSELRPPTILFFVAEPIRINKAQGAELLASRSYTHYLTQFFAILDVIAPVLGHFDEPTPAAGQFDRSGPSAAQFDEPTPTAGHFDEPTPT